MLVFKGKAEVIERLDKPLRSATGSFIWPHVIRLLHYVRVPRAIQRKISRRALFARDGWRCAYCGTTNGRLTLDHIVPRSKGGESIWENVVTACAPCNLRKGDRSLEQAGMAAPHVTARTDADALHQARGAPDPVRLDALPACYGLNGFGREDARPGDSPFVRASMSGGRPASTGHRSPHSGGTVFTASCGP